jgi:hypothetical protein
VLKNIRCGLGQAHPKRDRGAEYAGYYWTVIDDLIEPQGLMLAAARQPRFFLRPVRPD